MVKETKYKSSSKQANVTLPILNFSAVLTASTTCYENPCLIMHLKILIVSISAPHKSNRKEPHSFIRLMKPGVYSYQTKTTATGLTIIQYYCNVIILLLLLTVYYLKLLHQNY